ncbi:MAG: purine-nucleoside phosphorylase, partial [Acutalibacteraceae bacterium]|jgi:purine-nucleoside phosphorylase
VGISYEEIPGFPVSTVASHAGKLVVGRLAGQPVAALCGRAHFYEGYGMDEVAFYVRVLSLLGVRGLVLTNAAGAVNETFRPGDLMVIEDHLFFHSLSPVRGEHDPAWGERFFDMTHAYSPALIALAVRQAAAMDLPLRRGVYFYMPGPQYETPAEIRAIRALGGDAVGMSTVPEVIVAAQCGLPVLAVSCITNMAAGIAPGKWRTTR